MLWVSLCLTPAGPQEQKQDPAPETEVNSIVSEGPPANTAGNAEEKSAEQEESEPPAGIQTEKAPQGTTEADQASSLPAGSIPSPEEEETQTEPTAQEGPPPVDQVPSEEAPGEALEEPSREGIQPPPIQPVTRPALTVPELDRVEMEAELSVFGSDFFAQADAPTAREGIPPPPTYTLGSGDELEIRFWSRVHPEERLTQTVNEEGQINLPPAGDLTVQGLTLEQCRTLVSDQLGRFFNELKVHVTLAHLRSIQVFVAGEVQRPGRKTLSALASLLEALYEAGGPNPRGSFRHIRLQRNRRTVTTFDLYDFLLQGRTEQDLTLYSGDTVFVPTTGPRVAVLGEVLRPAYYELLGGERLKEVLELAGGLRAAQYRRRILIDRIVDYERRILLDVDARDQTPNPSSNPLIQDGDRIFVLPVASFRRQIVTIAGPVVRPGTFQLTAGMRVSDLIGAAEGLDPAQEVLLERGEVYRQNPDGSIQLQTFDVAQALQRDPKADLLLQEWDRVVLFPATQVWPHYVTIEGNVSRPGNYPRTEGMKVRDLLFIAGGLVPDSYLQEAHLIRVTPEETKATLKVDLTKAQADDPEHNLILQDRDLLRIFSFGEIEERALKVTVQGAVRRPGDYELKVGMTVRDLLFEAGGPVPNQAYLTQADLRRMNEDGTRRIEHVNLLLAQQEDPKHNVALQHQDVLYVYTWEERQARDQWVRIEGAVARPGDYELKQGMTIQDLLIESGGPLPKQAHLEHAHLIRMQPDQRREILTLNLIEVQNSNPQHNLELQGQDVLRVYSWEEIEYRLKTVHISGAVARPGDYELKQGMTVQDLILMAGGVLPKSAYLERAELTRTHQDQIRETIPLDLRAVQAGDPTQNVALEGDDELHVYTYDEVRADERIVSIEGAVLRPQEYEWTQNMTVSDLLFKAGGPLPNEAYLSRAHLYRVQPDGSTALIVINLQRALDQDPEHNRLLKPRDRLQVFTFDDIQHRLRFVKVEGAVARPQEYEWHAGMTVQDLLAEAGGPLPNEAYLERAYLIRTQEDQSRKMIPLNLVAAQDSDPEHNLPLQGDDVLRVYSHHEAQIPLDQVHIEGAVARPGDYELKHGMTIQDLLQEAGGYLPNQAYLSRADLYRSRPDQTRETRAVDLRQALDSNPAHNLELQGEDTLHVYTWDEYQYRDKMVTIEGAVARPDNYELTQNMKVSDLLIKAGGPLPKEAYLAQAHLTRILPDQTPEIHRIDLRLAQNHDPEHDIVLEGRDTLRVYTYEEAQFLEKEVTIEGPVQQPGVYVWKRGMRISDLLREAGGPIPKEAYLHQANLIRLQEDGKQRILRVDLERALQGDEAEDVLLEGRDTLRVFTHDEVEVRQPIVRIQGAVRRPGMYDRPEGMTLSDLIMEAGGLLPGVYPIAEISRPQGENVVILQADLEALLNEGEETQDVVLQDHDLVSIRRPAEFIPKPAMVELRGEVMLPGSYALEGRHGSLYQILQRAGGLTTDAFPEGAVFIRDVDLLVTNEQARIVLQVADTLEQAADVRFQAWLAAQGGTVGATGSGVRSPLARAATRKSSPPPQTTRQTKTTTPAHPRIDSEQHRAQAGEDPVATPSSESPTSPTRQTPTSTTDAELSMAEITALSRITSELGTPGKQEKAVGIAPRELMQIIPSGRIPIDLKRILESQGAEGDILLQDGDTLIVPPHPQHVTIAGAVTNQGSVLFEPNLRLMDYVEQVGGVTQDADLKHIVSVKPDGRVFQVHPNTPLELGDFVLIPTKAMLYEPGHAWQDRLQQALSTIVNAATLYLLVDRL